MPLNVSITLNCFIDLDLLDLPESSIVSYEGSAKLPESTGILYLQINLKFYLNNIIEWDVETRLSQTGNW